MKKQIIVKMLKPKETKSEKREEKRDEKMEMKIMKGMHKMMKGKKC